VGLLEVLLEKPPVVDGVDAVVVVVADIAVADAVVVVDTVVVVVFSSFVAVADVA